MKIGIICAMEEELTSIFTELNLKSEKSCVKGFEIYKATYLGHELYFILCGIGKVNAAIHTQYLIFDFAPDYVINVGVAGNLSKELNFGDVVIAHDLIHHDMDVSGFGLPLGQVPRMDVFAFPCSSELLRHASTISHHEFKITAGRIATGDQFVDNKERATFIHNEFNAIACEMEGVAVAHTCHVNKVPFLIVRALSDMAGQGDTLATHSFEQLKDMVAARASFVVKKLLELI